jgi:hypothetical protein
MSSRYRLTAIAIYVGPVPVNGYRHLCGTGTGLRLSQFMWSRYRLTAIAIYVEPVPVNGYRNLCGAGTV